MKKINLSINLAVLIVTIVILALFFPLRQGLLGSNQVTQQNISTVLYIVSALMFAGLVVFSYLKSNIRTKIFVGIVLVLLLALVIASSYVIFMFDSSHENMHSMEKYMLFASVSAFIIMLLATIFSLLQVGKILITKKNQ